MFVCDFVRDVVWYAVVCVCCVVCVCALSSNVCECVVCDLLCGLFVVLACSFKCASVVCVLGLLCDAQWIAFVLLFFVVEGF